MLNIGYFWSALKLANSATIDFETTGNWFQGRFCFVNK